MSDTSSGPDPEILTEAGPSAAGATVLPAEDAGSHRAAGSRKRGLVIGGAVLGAALLCGAGFAVAQVLSGGGAQPEDVLPSGVVAFADIDLDPSAAQKVDALRFLHSFPQVKDVAGSSDDLRETLVSALFGHRTDIDAATQIEPWLGDRAGIAALREGSDLELVGVVQTTDTDKAQQSLDQILASQRSGMSVGYAVSGDYVVIARSTAEARSIVAAGQQNPLSQDSAFTAAFDGLGDGVASFYVDASALKGVTSLSGEPVPTGQLAELTADGTAAGIVRFDPDAVELLAQASGASTQAVASEPTSLVATLPGSTMVAVGAASPTSAVSEGLDRLLKRLDSTTGMDTAAMLQRQYGLRLPQDLVTFFGSDRVLAIDGPADGTMAGLPSIGYRSITDPAAAAGLVHRIEPLVSQVTGGFGLIARPTSDGLVMATTPQYAAALSAGDGDLGTTQAFQDAVPDADGASAIAFVDVDRLSAMLHALEPGVHTANIDPVQAVGASVTVDGDTTSYRVRLTLG